MLAQLEDELARSRKREAFWISIIVHIVVVLLIIFSPELLPKWAQPHLLKAEDLQQKSTFVTLPNDLQKPPEKVNTNKLSDKNRIAETRRPQIDRKTLDELRTRGDMRAPGPVGPPMTQPPQAAPPQSMPQQAMVMPRSLPQPPAQALAQPTTMNPLLSLREPKPQPQQPAENPFKSAGSAGSMISKAIEGPQPHFPTGGGGSGYGAGEFDHRRRIGNFEVLSDTQGADIGPYLARLKPIVEMNMGLLAPESARPPLLKRGKVLIRFLIMPDGKVTGMQIETGSGDIALDRASWGSITASNPFPAFPSNFHFPYLALQAEMWWNPSLEDLEALQ